MNISISCSCNLGRGYIGCEDNKTKQCPGCRENICINKSIYTCQYCGYSCCSNGSQRASAHPNLTPIRDHINDGGYVLVCGRHSV